MDCFCGCGSKLPNRLTEANLLASRVALDLLAWDKARAQGRLGSQRAEFESLIARGENAYDRLILLLHGEGRDGTVAENEAWLEESFDERAGRRDMTTEGSLFTRPKLLLGDEDYQVLDRRHPGQSFSAQAPLEPGVPTDVADQLERLGRLHAEGILSDEEFAAAKDGVIRSLRSG
jgi:hypothetical protein